VGESVPWRGNRCCGVKHCHHVEGFWNRKEVGQSRKVWGTRGWQSFGRGGDTREKQKIARSETDEEIGTVLHGTGRGKK